MPRLDDVSPEMKAALEGRYGPGAVAPPLREPFAAILAAWLDLAVDPKKTAAALQSLDDLGLLAPDAWHEVAPGEVVDALRSGGVKVAPKAVIPLLRLALWAANRGADRLPDAPTPALRDELVAIRGIGPPTADGILLGGLNRAVYPVDRPSYRVFARHGWIDPTADYDEARDVFERLAPDDPDGLRRLSHALRGVAAEFCRATRPLCEACPLRPFLPPAGPVVAEGE